MSGSNPLIKAVISTLDTIPVAKKPLKKLRDIKRHYFRRSEGEELLILRYEKLFFKSLDLSNPKTFTDKVFCKMIALNRKNDPLLTRLADKLLVRDWVESKIGSQHLVKVYWSGPDPAKIPFDDLPEKYVIKTNHASGQVIEKKAETVLDHKKVRQQLNDWMSQNFYWVVREYQYYEIKPQILIEEFLDDGISDGPLDFKFWCFNGQAKIVQIDNHSRSINLFLDMEWNLLDLSNRTNMTNRLIEQPENFSKMIELANKLSAEFDFVRVDLYNLKGKILFGEMTFTPAAGALKFEPQTWDAKLGDLWKVDPKYHLNN